MKIVVVGVGALGSNFLQFARNLDADFTVIDHDRVEIKNTKSQFHAKTSVGRNKTQSLQQLMQMCWGIKINTIPHKLTENNVKQLLGEADLVVDCLDNAPSRQLVQDFVRANDIPCLHGALAANGEFGKVQWDDTFVVEETKGGATCEDGEELPFIIRTASYMAASVADFLATGKQPGYQILRTGSIST